MGGFANNAPIVTDGLVFYVDAGNSKSYPGSGTSWTDLIGSADGTLTNGPTYNSSNGGSIVLDGVDDSITFPHDDAFNMGNNFTISLWIYPTKNHEAHTVLLQKASATDDNTIYFRLKFRSLSTGIGEVTSSGDGDYDIRFGVGQGSTRYIIAFGDLSSYLDQWNNVVATCNGSTIKMFWNADEKVSYTGVPTLTENTSDIVVSDGTIFPPSNDSLEGRLNLIKIYNRALSSSEITQNYNALKNRFV